MSTGRVLAAAFLFLATVPAAAGSALPGIADSNLSALVPAPEPPVAAVDAGLMDLLAAGSPQPVILVLDPALQENVLDRLSDLGVEHHLYDRLHMAAALLDAPTAAVVQALPGVRGMHRNERMNAMLDESVEYLGARVLWDTYGVTGKGVTVMVIDSGVDGTHPDVKYKENLIENVVVTRANGGLVGGSKEGVVSSDPDGHGTHVAAIIGGTSRASQSFAPGKFRGVAYQARLVGYQAGVADRETGEVSFESVTVLEAFNWALANKARHGIRVVSNSWGANGDFDPRSPINIATLNLYKAGLVVVFAAGNEGDQGPHSLNKYSVAPWVLSVAAGDYVNNVPRFSSRGTDPDESGQAYDHPDVVAPGVGIVSARARTNKIGLKSGDAESGSYAAKSGSSMAAPHVAGVAALLLQANPKLSPDDVMDLLTATATPMPRYETWEAGAGYVNALKAYQLAKRTVGHRDEFLSGKVKYAGPSSGDAKYERDAVSVGYGKGAAHRLRSPDVSLGSFLVGLFTTAPGLIFLAGSFALGFGAFARGSSRRRVQAVHLPDARQRLSLTWVPVPGAAASSTSVPNPGPAPPKAAAPPHVRPNVVPRPTSTVRTHPPTPKNAGGKAAVGLEPPRRLVHKRAAA